MDRNEQVPEFYPNQMLPEKNMATGVNMCTFRTITSCVRYLLNKHPRPLLSNAQRCLPVTHEFLTHHCRTVCSDSCVRNVVRQNPFICRQIGLLFARRGLQRVESAKSLSTEQKPSITEEILKSKVDASVKTAGTDQSFQESQKSSDKSDSWFAGKNAWKLGLLSLAGMGILMCGNVLILWGTLNNVIFVFCKILTCYCLGKRSL